MQIIYSLHTILLLLWATLSFFVGTTTALLLSPFVPDRARLFHFTGRIWAWSIVLFSGIRIDIKGKKHVPRKRTVIFASNHQGVADILILLGYLRSQFRFIAKKELFKVPLFGFYMRLAGYLPVDRVSVRSAQKTLEQAAEIIKGGASILIFPEGTRTHDGEVGAFKSGIADLYFKTGAPIVPIAISGSFHIMKKGSRVLRPHPVKIRIGKPIVLQHHRGTERDLKLIVQRTEAAVRKLLQQG